MSVTLVPGRFQERLAELKGVRTFVTDPPYNLGFDYGPISDRLPKEEYHAMMADMMRLTHEAALDDASLFIIHYPEAMADLWPVLNGSGWIFRQWLTWTYPTNICGGNHAYKWPRGSRAVLWFVKGDPPFNLKATVQPYRNPNDNRVKANIANGSSGAPLYDWWEINQVKGGSKVHRGYANQIPPELIKRCILATTEPGDLVADPFAGTGSTAKTADRLGRDGWGCDPNPVAQTHWGLAAVCSIVEAEHE